MIALTHCRRSSVRSVPPSLVAIQSISHAPQLDDHIANVGCAQGRRRAADAAEGRDPQLPLGHKSAKITDIYRDIRGAEWIDVA